MPKRQPRQTSPGLSTFPFLRLPADIRTNIYQFCLIHPDPIAIGKGLPRYDSPLDVTGQFSRAIAAMRGEDEPRLVLFNSWKRDLVSHVSLLSTCRMIYEEASTIVYKFNKFQFPCKKNYGKTLEIFAERLIPRTQECIRNIEIEFPHIQRSEDGRGHFGAQGMCAAKALKSFTTITNLQLNLSQDLLTLDKPLLIMSRHSIPTACKIVIMVGETNSYGSTGPSVSRAVRISQEIVKQLDAWGWKLQGERDIVGSDHEFSDEVKWISSLEQSRINKMERRDRREEREMREMFGDSDSDGLSDYMDDRSKYW